MSDALKITITAYQGEENIGEFSVQALMAGDTMELTDQGNFRLLLTASDAQPEEDLPDHE